MATDHHTQTLNMYTGANSFDSTPDPQLLTELYSIGLIIVKKKKMWAGEKNYGLLLLLNVRVTVQ